jgi:hypothetical protein
MTSPPRPATGLAPLLHLLAGAVLGTGLVAVALWGKEARPASAFPATARDLASWALFGAVGGLLGGVVAGVRSAGGDRDAPGIRFWMLALGAGGALTLGAIGVREARSIPTGEDYGPAVHVLRWLIVGWLVGVLLGAVGSAFAEAATPALSVGLRLRSAKRELAAVLSGAVWAAFWAGLVVLLVLVALGVVLLSVRAGDDGPALAVGGTCGGIFFALRFVLCIGRGARP